MANKKAEILTMDGQVVSPITLVTNVLLDDGRTAQDLLDSRDESMFSPTITTSSSISKVGQGDNVDFSENVIDGAYKSCVLKGKTLVNYNTEGNDRNDYTCMPSVEGQNVTVNDTVEGKVRSAILKGQTDFYGYTYDGGVLNDTGIYRYDGSLLNNADTKGWFTTETLIKVEIGNYIVEDDGNEGDGYLYIYFYEEDGRYKGDANRLDLALRNEFAINEVSYIRICRRKSKVDRLKVYDKSKLSLISVKVPVLTTIGKNLMSSSLRYDVFLENDGLESTYYQDIVSKEFIQVESSTSYGIATFYQGEMLNPQNIFICEYDNGKNFIKRFNATPYGVFATDINTKYIKFSIGGAGIPGDIEERKKIFIELEKTKIKPTAYEPYKSNILTVNEPIELRGIGDIQDELDLLTGEVTERIGEVSTSLMTPQAISKGANASVIFVNYNSNFVGWYNQNIICDKLKYVNGADSNWDNASSINGVALSPTGFWFIVPSTITTQEQANEYLNNLNATIQYQLTTESVKTVDLSDNMVYSYKDTTHYACSSEEGSLVPTLSIEEGVKYKAIIKPSTKYSIVFNRTEVASGLTVDLGGATANITSTTLGKNIVQITTPPTLSHNYVIFKGLGNVIKDVQVIEGDVVGDEPYFEGMADVKNPSVMNCNTLDTEDENYKSNTVTTNEAVLRSLPNGVSDTLDLETGVYVQRIGEREYQVGDESNSQVLTDKVNTQYELATPIITTIDLKQHPFAYKDGYVVLTSSSEEISLTPTIEYSLIANRLGQIQTNQKLVEKQQVQIDDLESMVIANLVNTQYQQALNEIKLGVK